jgi:isopenicillin N synthase-like dioxygenase
MSAALQQVSVDAWKSARALPFDHIPAIDMAAFLDGSDRQGVADRIGQACREVGFLYLTNHGIAAGLVDAAMAEARRFFALPDARKMAIHIAKSPAHRGYFPYFGENNDPKNARDLKEGFDIARDVAADDPRVLAGKPLHGPNVWPEDVPGFRETIETYYAALTRLAGQLMEAFALSLHLPQAYFHAMLDEAMGALRLLHYPPQPPAAEAGVVGTGSHTDYGCLTILAQDAVGGLQVRNSAGEWVAAPPVPGAFVVNIGDQMARWTNGFFASTFHRVANLSGQARYSIPCFVGANPDTVIQALPSCTGPNNPPKFEPVVAGEYVSTLIYHQFYDNHAPHPIKSGHLGGAHP